MEQEMMNRRNCFKLAWAKKNVDYEIHTATLSTSRAARPCDWTELVK